MIRSLAEKLNFPPEATDSLDACYKKMIAAEGLLYDIECVKEEIFYGNDRGFTKNLEEIAKKADVNRYQSDMVVLMLCIPTLKQLYHSRGIDESILWDSMSDLRCKLFECREVKGVWGNFVAYWYGIFFRLTCFKLGRLEYEETTFKPQGYKDIIKCGDKVLTCHIPSEGPLLEAEVIASLKKAYEFYPQYVKDGILPVTCHSWLLYPPYKGRVFTEGSNIEKFISLFDIVEYADSDGCGDLWRVFKAEYSEGCIPSLPENTSLQRNLKSFLIEGNKMGDAYGVILFDGEKVITSQK